MSFLRPPRFLVGIFFISVVVFTPLSAVFADGNTITTAQVQQSLDYIWTNQDPTTGGLSEGLTQSFWAAMTFVAAGYNPDTVKQTETSPSLLEYIKDNACGINDVTTLENVILALRASRINLDDFSTERCGPKPEDNLKAKLESFEDSSTGKIGPNLVSTIFGLIAYKSYGHIIDQSLITYILSQQQKSDGGWIGYEYPGAVSDTNTTAEAIMAINQGSTNTSGVNTAIDKAKAYLQLMQDNSGGIKYDSNQWTTDADSFSDTYVLQAISLIRDNPSSPEWLKNNQSIMDHLASLRQADGSYDWMIGTPLGPVKTTAIVIQALLNRSLPILPTSQLLNFPLRQVDTNTAKDTNNDQKPVQANNTSPKISAKSDQATKTIQSTPTITPTQVTKPTVQNSPPNAFKNLSNVPDNSTTEIVKVNNGNINLNNKTGKVLGSEDNKNRQNSSNNNWIYTLIGLSGALIGFFLYRLSISK